MSVLRVPVFAWVQYGLSSDDWDGSDGVFGKGHEESCRFFSFPMLLTCFFTFLQMNVATGRTDRQAVGARLVNAFTNVNGWVQPLFLHSNTWSNALFCDVSIKIRFTKWKDAVFCLLFVNSKLMRNASERASAIAFGTALFTLLQYVQSAFSWVIYCIIARADWRCWRVWWWISPVQVAYSFLERVQAQVLHLQTTLHALKFRHFFARSVLKVLGHH